MLTMGGIGTIKNLTRSDKLTISAMLTVFYGGFCFGYALNYHVISAEIPSSRMYIPTREMTC
jgi:peptidase E